mmetsp:Transcript_33245/g.69250  ORF Transcript_33245/g.69250 Transcript_33245/m.69250 type:complete len:98 (+) Transcript_33245:66-359(+)
MHTWHQNANTTKLVVGSAWVVPYSFDIENSSFESSWHQQGQDLVTRLNELNPIQPNKTGYYHAPEDFFQTIDGGIAAGTYDLKVDHQQSSPANYALT